MYQRNQYVNNVWAIVLSFYPIGIILLAYVVDPNEYMLGALLVMPVVLMFLDKKELKERGYETPTWWWVVFIPGYLYSRGSITPQYRYFKGLAIMGIAVVMIAQLVEIFGGPIGDDASAKKAYCQTVTEIYHEDKHDVRCLAVDYVNKVADKEYRGIAQLDNGEDIYFTASWSDNETYQLTLRRGFKL